MQKGCGSSGRASAWQAQALSSNPNTDRNKQTYTQISLPPSILKFQQPIGLLNETRLTRSLSLACLHLYVGLVPTDILIFLLNITIHSLTPA
jgi:hypothetical protein